MSNVVTELVISADTTGADQFSQSMDKASSSAQQGLGSVASLTLAVAGVGVAFVGALTGLRAFYDYVGNQNKQLIDIAEGATRAGISTKEFQEDLFAARSKGLTEKDFVSGLDKISEDLNKAGQGVTDFGKLFSQNGLSIKDTNDKLITTKVALSEIAGLMENATPAVQQGIARIVGLSQSWIPFLRDGVDAIEAQKKVAQDLGVIIDDSTIQKAKEFNDQWHQAVATWDLQFKAAIAGILPSLVQMANLAATIINGVSSVSSSVSRWATPDDSKSKDQLAAQIDDAIRLRDLMTDLNNGGATGGIGQLRVTNLAGLLGLPEDANITQVNALIDKLGALYDKEPTKLTVNKDLTTVLPQTDDAKRDQLDTEIDRLNKHIALTKADTEAVGEGAAAQAGLRAEAALYAAAERAGKTDLEQYADQFFALRQRIEETTQALNKAKIASDIKFGRDTSFLSQQDVQIAQQLRSIYPNVATALGSVEANGIRVNNAFKDISSSIETNLTAGLTDIAMGAKTAGQAFSDMGLAVIKSLEQMIIKITIVEPMMRALQSAIGGGSILNLFGGGGGLPTPGASNFIGPLLPSATGNVFANDNIIPFAQGASFTNSIVDSPTLFKFAAGTGMMGEAGPEAIVPLKRGADGSLGVASSSGGGGGGTSQVFNYAPNIDARGADAQAVARIAQVVANDRKEFEKNVAGVMAKYHTNNPRR